MGNKRVGWLYPPWIMVSTLMVIPFLIRAENATYFFLFLWSVYACSSIWECPKREAAFWSVLVILGYGILRTLIALAPMSYTLQSLLALSILALLLLFPVVLPLEKIHRNFVILACACAFFMLFLYGISRIHTHICVDSSLKLKNAIILLNILSVPTLILNKRYGSFWVLLVLLVNTMFCARTALLGFMFGMLAMTLARQWPRFIALGITAGITSCSILSFMLFSNLYHAPYIQALGKKFPTFYERTLVWRHVYTLWQTHPYFGVGPSTLSAMLNHPFPSMVQGKEKMVRIVHPHSLVLELLASLGWVGTGLALLSFIISMISFAKKPLSMQHFFILFLVLYVFIVFSGYASLSKDPWILGWIGLILMVSRSFLDSPAPPSKGQRPLSA
jgi:O-antigen ligase